MSVQRVSRSAEEYAFCHNLVGYLLEDPVRERPQLLSISETKRNTSARDFLQENPDTIIPSFKPSLQEETLDQDLTGVWVGLWVPSYNPSSIPKKRCAPNETAGETEASASFSSEATEEASTVSPGTAAMKVRKAPTVKGQSVQSVAARGFEVIQTDPKALRVICPRGRLTASHYGLLDQVGGLCSAYAVPREQVFYFPEFRDDTIATVPGRETAWSNKVKEVTNAKDEEPRTSNDTSLEVVPQRSLSNDVKRMLDSYESSHDPTYLDQVLDTIREVDTEGIVPPPDANPALVKLLQTENVLDLEDCRAALEQILVSAPRLERMNLTSAEIQDVSRGFVDSGIILPYRHLATYIVHFVKACRINRNSGTAIDFGESAIDHAEKALMIGPVPEYEGEAGKYFDCNMLVRSERVKVEAILRRVHQGVKALQDSQGTAVRESALSMSQQCAEWDGTPDLASAELFASDLHRRIELNYHNVVEPALKFLKAQVEELRKLEEAREVIEGGEDMAGQ